MKNCATLAYQKTLAGRQCHPADHIVGGDGNDHCDAQGHSYDTLLGGEGDDRGIDFDMDDVGNLVHEIDDNYEMVDELMAML